MVNDGVNSYVWDHANRLLSMGGISYAYNGDGNRIQQDALNYILDLQPGLVQVIGDSDGNRYIHSPRGIHAVNDGTGWQYPLADALGSVRGYIDAHSNVISNVNYTPIGVPDANIAGPAFTGEWRTAGTGIQYHSARHLSPGLGVWLSRDPFEGAMDRPMSLNSYLYANGNPNRYIDSTGALPCDTATGQDSDCLNRIVGTLQTVANNGELLGIFAPASGAAAVSRTIWHYLSASGNIMYFSYDWMDPDFHQIVADMVENAFQNTSYFQDICSGGCCNAFDASGIGTLVQNSEVRGRRYFVIQPSQGIDETPDWYRNLIDPIKEQVTIGSPGNQFIINPFYGAYGGVAANSVDQTAVRVISTSGANAEIELLTPIEYYDYYDWLFGGCGAGGIATGTHPQNMRVGHFIAIEKAGRAKPFNWYSYTDIRIRLSLTCAGSQPVLTNRQISISQGQQLTTPIHPPCNTPTQWNSPNFVDNWTPTLTSALRARGYDGLFPTEQQMDADGNIN